MDYVYEVCNRCVDRHCCRGLCKEMNDYLAKKKNQKQSKTISPLNRTDKVVK